MTDKGMTEKISIDEAINEFYKMKDRYETMYKEKYVNPILKARNLSKKEKRSEFAKLPKPQCINCNRNVGTVFLIKQENDFYKKYVAKCGDLSEPCPLNIIIHYGTRFTYENEINKFVDDIEQIKGEIIKEKYNMMFGYVQDEGAILTFEDLSASIKESSLLAGSIIEKNILVNNNPEKAELLKKSIDIFGKEYVLQFKHMIKKYNETGDELIIEDAIDFYKNEMMPRIKEIQELKYEINMVEYDPEQFIFSLRQRKNSLQNLEYAFSKESKVVAFVKGSGQAPKTRKNIKSIASSKTRRRKSIMLVEDNENEGLQEEKQEGLEEELAEEPIKTYNPNSLEYNPNSPEYVPNSPEYVPNSPEYNPISP